MSQVFFKISRIIGKPTLISKVTKGVWRSVLNLQNNETTLHSRIRHDFDLCLPTWPLPYPDPQYLMAVNDLLKGLSAGCLDQYLLCNKQS